jgi:thioredoxin-related protein
MRLKLLLFICLLSFGTADSFHWQGNYDKALEQAKREQKTLLVFVVKRECPLCHRVIQEQFGRQPYIRELNRKTVAVMVTYADIVHYPVELYWTNIYPALFVVDAHKELFLHKPLYGSEITTENMAKLAKKLPASTACCEQ